MLLGKIFEPFIEKRPVCVMARGILERLLDPRRVDQVFADHARRQYTRDLLFSTVVQLMGGYGSTYALRFNPNGWTTAAGHTYHVSVTGASQAIEYDVEVVDCK